jgi:hypothetical protein
MEPKISLLAFEVLLGPWKLFLEQTKFSIELLWFDM